jgi:hypothetical protein
VERSGIFFIHIMKTGGTSLDMALRGMFDSRSAYPGLDPETSPGHKVDIARLLDGLPEQDVPIRFISVHMPAWVAERFAARYVTATVLREPVTRTLSHLRHIARLSALTSDDIEEVYDDPPYRARLANYQTRVLSQTAHQYEADRRIGDDLARAAETGSEVARREFVAFAGPLFATALANGDPLTGADLDAAIERLERFDEVGTTDRLNDFVARLAIRCRLPTPVLRVLNTSTTEVEAPASLVERIRADNALDVELYAHACRLANRGADER